MYQETTAGLVWVAIASLFREAPERAGISQCELPNPDRIPAKYHDLIACEHSQDWLRHVTSTGNEESGTARLRRNELCLGAGIQFIADLSFNYL